jgi:hypothetical protein
VSECQQKQEREAEAYSSYNLVNGTYSCENDRAMNRILKDELGFQGLYVYCLKGEKATS